MPPIVMNTNNRILPNNSRVADVSRQTIDKALPIQIRKYHNAFVVQGNQCIIYNRLNNGVKCGCKAKVSSVKTRLGQDGRASPELINELLTGGHEFGILAYGSEIADAPNSRELPSVSSDWTITDTTRNKKVELYNRTDNPDSGPMTGAHHDVWSNDPNNPNAGTITYSGFGPGGPAGMDDDLETLTFDDDKFDVLSLGIRDCACPVCFGSGFVGGFQVFNGWRKVINFQWPDLELFDSNINYDVDVPSVTGNKAEFKVQLPRGAVHTDALKVWNYNKVVPATFIVDGVTLTSEHDLLNFFDGTTHTIRVEMSQNEHVTWTHIEMQVHQSEDIAYLDFPKMTKSSIQSKIEAFVDVQLVVSPLVPLVRTLDVVADSTYNKIFQVKDCTWWNDKKLTILGWDCNVRPVQPAELYALLPKCRPIRSSNRPTMVTTNLSNAV